MNNARPSLKIEFNHHTIKQIGDYIRYLSLMSIQKANSGHPGLPLGCADCAAILYQHFIQNTPANCTWAARDRFVLSAGHGSMLVYSLNYLYGFGYTISDLAGFRQIGTKTAGHPEYHIERGIETTTGPLGQGIANAVGMAIEGKMLKSRYGKNTDLFDYTIYTLMGDGCNMEGLSSEAASLAGHLGLDNLLAIYDSNSITIDGNTNITFTENVAMRYQAQGWSTDTVDGADLPQVYQKIKELSSQKNGKPKLLVMKTLIGEGLNKLKGTHSIHGAPAGIDEIVYFILNSSVRDVFIAAHNIKADEASVKTKVQEEIASGAFVPVESFPAIVKAVSERNKEVAKSTVSWQSEFEKTVHNNAATGAEFDAVQKNVIPAVLKNDLLSFTCDPDASRNISGAVLQLCAKHLPQIIGGSADLVGSTRATVKGSQYISSQNFSGRNIAFGVREHAMGAIGNGLALNKFFIPFTSTFFTFFDYMKTPVRLAALMKLKHLFIFTHDSIYVGEDGPTHQPIEHIGSLRLIPGLYTFRPASDMETAFSYLYFLEHEGPAVILGTRQNLNTSLFKAFTDNRAEMYGKFSNGAYIIEDCSGEPDIILAGSGSEVGTLLEAKVLIEKNKKKVRLVSIPCMELFEESDSSYKQSLLGNGKTPVYLAEAMSYRGFTSFMAPHIRIKTMNEFGCSGPYKKVAQHFGFCAESVAEECLKMQGGD